jgi:hypothetical protein
VPKCTAGKPWTFGSVVKAFDASWGERVLKQQDYLLIANVVMSTDIAPRVTQRVKESNAGELLGESKQQTRNRRLHLSKVLSVEEEYL